MSKTLDELVKIIQFKLKLNQEDIADRLGYSRGHLSKMIKNNDSDCIEKIKIEFPNELQNITNKDIVVKQDATSLSHLIEGNRNLSQANKDLAAANLRLTAMLEINSSNDLQLKHAQACLERIAEQGAGVALQWKTKAEGLKVLGNFLTETVLKKVQVNK